jgi:hypothetical protein
MNNFLNDLVTKGDPGKVIAEEIEQAISPVTEEVSAIRNDLQEFKETLARIERLLVSLQPLLNFLNKLPFFK